MSKEETKVEEPKEVKKLNLFEKLSRISNEMGSVSKNLEVGFGNSKYKAVGEADVLKAVKQLELKYGVFSYPYNRNIIESGTIESVNNKGEVKKNLFERIEVTYRFVNTDNPSEYIDIISYGDGIDPQDKSVGKAMTYADKYALMKAYKIVTGDDPDQEASNDLKSSATKKETRLDPKLLAECERLKITIENVSAYRKKQVEDVNNEDLKYCIELKKEALKKRAEANK